MRADKFLWAVRLSKTRADAADALRGGKILINGVDAKPSRELNVGDTISVKHMPAIFTYKIKALLERRVGAKLVEDYIVDTTPAAEIEKLELSRLDTSGKRERGAGRPTKRERRELDSVMTESNFEAGNDPRRSF